MPAVRCQESVVKTLLKDKHIRVNAADKNGWTALMDACQNGHDSLVKLLIREGKADVNITQVDGWYVYIYIYMCVCVCMCVYVCIYILKCINHK